jgi:4-diphosphocytidyl-2-C-methyl-D-erythritol kinase
VDLCDDVVVARRGSGIGLSVEGADLGPAVENLAYRAARAFLEAVGARTRVGVEIRLRKRIPAGSGLGGGSSDAAAVLRCLDRLAARPLPRSTLVEIGACLGSDVPFFLGGAALARGRGRGELLDPLPALPVRHLVLVLPPVHVATGAAYGSLARLRQGRRPSDRPPWADGGVSGWDDVADWAENDFEEVVPPAHAAVERSLEALRGAGAQPALLSGSGAACFGVFPDERRAEAAAAALSATLGWDALPVRTLAALPEPSAVEA